LKSLDLISSLSWGSPLISTCSLSLLAYKSILWSASACSPWQASDISLLNGSFLIHSWPHFALWPLPIMVVNIKQLSIKLQQISNIKPKIVGLWYQLIHVKSNRITIA
jgi:hypothetical protein